MLDSRVTGLADLVCDHSLGLTKEDRVLVHAFDIPDVVVTEFVRAVQARGAAVQVRLEAGIVKRQILHGLTEATVGLIAETELAEMERMTAYVALRGGDNYAQQAGIPGENTTLWSKKYTKPVVLETRVPKTKWAVMRWPSHGMSQQASMSTPDFEDFFFRVCVMDYPRMSKACVPLKELMDRTDQVRILAPDTDLSFSIKGIGSVACCGEANIPDGECFSCPVRESVNGTIRFNTVSLFQGTEFTDIRYAIKNGKIVEATAGANTEKLNQILDTDEGARYFGEWSLGFNPYVLHPMKDTLFDEKIAGSFHLTPGNAYTGPGGNGNASAIHWDTVLIQRPEYGGGEIWFDGALVRKDGLFVLPELEGLNPDHLS
ncbi:MAG: aminopeptidase [Fimbriimonadaceae bacterium]|nr:aminopeptidase [Fimbriimonadaceae bacterium]